MEKNEVQKKGFFDKAMDFIEKIGNAMPDPVSLFIILAIVVVILSAILGSMGYSAVLQCGASRYGQNHSGY